MNKTLITSFAVTFGIVAALLAAGCDRKEKADTHAGDEHAPSKVVAQNASPAAAKVPLSGAKCAAHAAPKELCFICDASLREKGRLWCEEHKRYEDRCWVCHPELQDKKRLWCNEHSLYEDECFLCHPELRDKSTAAVTATAPLMCAEHGVPESECAVCKPELAAKLKPGEAMKVRLPSPNSAAMVGIETASPETAAIAEGLDCVAEVSFNQNRLAQIVTPIGGVIKSVEMDLGTVVRENQPVAKIWSAAIAETVAKCVLTHQTLERERKLFAGRVTSEQALQEAEAAHRAACQQARTFGFTEAQIDALGQTPNDPVYMEVRAPFAGEIVERNAVPGALVEPGKSLFTLADRSTMWAIIQIPEATLGRVRVGQSVELRIDSLPGQVFAGKLTWIAASVDDRTRMARARAEFGNPDGLLRNNMFATARILTRKVTGLQVPGSAIQRIEGRPYVFVKLEDDLFDARAIQLGAHQNDRFEVTIGVAPRDRVAVRHTFALKSAMLMSRLGAGCADD